MNKFNYLINWTTSKQSGKNIKAKVKKKKQKTLKTLCNPYDRERLLSAFFEELLQIKKKIKWSIREKHKVMNIQYIK